MKIETKFSIGQQVFFINMESGKVDTGIVWSIVTTTSNTGSKSAYKMSSWGNEINEDKLFINKEELIKSL